MSDAIIEPYLFFGGQCEEALEFYRTALGAEVGMVMHYFESPEPIPVGMIEEGFENKVMHAQFKVGSTLVMASDGREAGTSFEGFSLSLTVPTEDEAKRAFAALAEGGQVRMPLGKTFWSACFGMVQDRFGVNWMITVPQ